MIAVGARIREVARLRRVYGRRRWRNAKVSLGSGLTMARRERPRSTGTKRAASAKKRSRSSASSRDGRVRHVVCIANAGYPVGLEKRKIYAAIADAEAAKLGMVRVIDESGEDYLYPRDFFSEIQLSPALAKALAAAT